MSASRALSETPATAPEREHVSPHVEGRALTEGAWPREDGSITSWRAALRSAGERESNATEGGANAVESWDDALLFMIDGGSNIDLFKSPELYAHGTQIDGPVSSVDGVWGDSSVLSLHLEADVLFEGEGDNLVRISGAWAEKSRKNVLADSSVWDRYRMRVLKEPVMQLIHPGGSIPLHRINGLYYVRGHVLPRSECNLTSASWQEAEANVTTARQVGKVEMARRWAARMHVNGHGLRDLAAATAGTGLNAIDGVMEAVADNDTIIKRSNMRRVPVEEQTPADRRATSPGERLILDAFYSPAPSAEDGSHYELNAVCQVTSFGYEETYKSQDQEAYLAFIDIVIASELALGHVVKYVRIDADPRIEHSKLRDRIAELHGAKVEFAGGGDHEGVAAAESKIDTKQRIAEGFMMRAELPATFLLPFRKHAGRVLNHRCVRGRSLTRIEHHTSVRADLSRPIMYHPGIECAVLVDEPERGPKGAGCHPESTAKGRQQNALLLYVAMDGRYVVLAQKTRRRLRRRNVTPLNEHVVLRRGVPSGDETSESGTQTEASDAAAATEPEPAAAPSPAAPTPTPCDELGLIGTRIHVLWPKLQHAGYYAALVQSSTRAAKTGAERYSMRYDNPTGQWGENDLNGCHRMTDVTWRREGDRSQYEVDEHGRWFLLDADSSAAPANPLPTPADVALPAAYVGPPGMRTRARAAANSLEAFLDSRVPPSQMVDFFNASVFQHVPEMAEACHAESYLDLADKMQLLHRAADHVDASTNVCEVACFECNKAAAEAVLVMTDLGLREERAPATTKQRDAAPDAEQWKSADEAALDVVVRAGNPLVPESKPRRLGQPIYKSVIQRKIKVHKATQRLDKRKSRLCHDGKQAKHVARQRGIEVERGPHASVADDLLIQMTVANSASRRADPVRGIRARGRKRRVKVDVGNAYCKAQRRRPVTWMSLGTALERHDESGERLCVELRTPLYGEETAGDEWDVDSSAELINMGWVQAEGEECLYHFTTPDGERHELIRVVDDYLILICDGEGDALAAATISVLERLYDGEVTVEWDTVEYVGYAFVDGPDGTVAISMTHHVESAVATFRSGIADGSDRPSAQLARFQTMEKLADSIVSKPSTGALTPPQKRVQRIVGALKYPERIISALTLFLHRLSCALHNPCDACVQLADLTLELAYDHRYDCRVYGDVEPRPIGVRLGCSLAEGNVPPQETEAAADASWAAGINPEGISELPPLDTAIAPLDETGLVAATKDLFGVVITSNGAAVSVFTKSLALLVDSTCGAEQVATSKAAELLVRAANIERAFGANDARPLAIGSDNSANVQIANKKGAAARAKHLLRRYYTLVQRVREGEIDVVHLPDVENVADFLTKFVPAEKLKRSLRYISGGRPTGWVKSAIQKRRKA